MNNPTPTITEKKTTFRESVSKILVKWGMGTKQVAILEIVREHEALIALVEKGVRECPRHHEQLRCRSCLAELQEIGEIQHGILCGCMDAEDMLHFTCSHNWCKTCPEPKGGATE